LGVVGSGREPGMHKFKIGNTCFPHALLV
jgi:hypothetical protein